MSYFETLSNHDKLDLRSERFIIETEVPKTSLAFDTIACNSFRYGATSELGKEIAVLAVDSDDLELREVTSGEPGLRI